MARKLLRFFAVDDPSDAWVERVAADFAASKTVGDVLERLFLSDAFYEQDVMLSLVKTPVEYVVGWMRTFSLPLSRSYLTVLRNMGQELYSPPDVAGWRGGTTWLMASWLLVRYQFAEAVAYRLNGAELEGAGVTANPSPQGSNFVQSVAERLGIGALGPGTANALQAYANDTLGQAAKAAHPKGIRGLLHLLMASPEAQMK